MGCRRGPDMLFPAFPDAAALIGRIALGALFLTHGWPKLKDIRKPIGFVKGTGWPGGAAFAILFTLLEFFRDRADPRVPDADRGGPLCPRNDRDDHLPEDEDAREVQR